MKLVRHKYQVADPTLVEVPATGVIALDIEQRCLRRQAEWTLSRPDIAHFKIRRPKR